METKTDTIQAGRYTRKLGAKIFMLDQEKLTEKVQNVVRAQYGEDSNWEKVTTWIQVIGFLENPEIPFEGYDIAVINTEGVGYVVDNHKRVTVLYNLEGGGDGWVDISAKLVRECLNGEVTDLAEFVRVFGDRLENNYDVWYNRLKKEE